SPSRQRTSVRSSAALSAETGGGREARGVGGIRGAGGTRRGRGSGGRDRPPQVERKRKAAARVVTPSAVNLRPAHAAWTEGRVGRKTPSSKRNPSRSPAQWSPPRSPRQS